MRGATATDRPAVRRQVDSVAAMVIGVALNVIAGLVVARILGPSIRGTMVSMTLVATGANVLLGGGLPAANCFNVSKNRETAGAAGLFSLVWGAGVPVAVWGVAVSTGAVVPLGRVIGLAPGAASVAILMSPLLLTYQQFAGVMQGLGAYAAVRVGRTVQGAAILGGSTLLALLHVHDAESYFVVWGVSFGAGAVYFASAIWSRYAVRVPTSQQVSETLAYGLRAMWTQAWELVNLRGDQFYVAALAPSSVLGIYAVGVGISELLMHVPTALSQVVFSNTAAGEQGSRQCTMESASRVFGVGALASIAMVAICFLVVPPLIGEGYRSVPVVFAILAVPTSLLGAGRMLGAFEMGRGRPGVPGTAAAVSLVVTLVLDALFVPLLGAVGAASACAAGYIAASAYLMAVFSRGHGLDPFAELWHGVVRVPATVSRLLEMVRG